MDLRDQVIRIWMICYDGDVDRIYSFTNHKKAVASVESSIRGYFGEDSIEFDKICEEVADKMVELRNAPCVPMRFDTLQVVVYNWELDSTNPIHYALSECLGQVNEGTRSKILDLFSTSVY